MAGQQIGHIPKGVAAKLAPFLDSGELYVEGTLTGEKGAFDVPVQLKLYGTTIPAAQQALKAKMKDANLPVKELIEEERRQKQQEKEREKERKAEQKRLLAQAANSTSSRGQKNGKARFEQEQDPTYANLNVPSDDPIAEGPSMDDILETSMDFNPREVGEVADKVGELQSCILPIANTLCSMDRPKSNFQLCHWRNNLHALPRKCFLIKYKACSGFLTMKVQCYHKLGVETQFSYGMPIATEATAI